MVFANLYTFLAYLALYLCRRFQFKVKDNMAKTSIQYIKEAAKKLVDSKLQRLGAAKTQEIFKGVMQTVGLESMEEVYLFVAQFDLTCRDRTSNMDDLSNYFECSSLDMIEYIPALKSLERKGILVRRRRREENIFKQDFAVSDTVMAAIIENQAVQISQIKIEEMQIDKYEFCKRIAEKVEDNDVISEDLIMFVEKLENSNPHLSFITELKKDVLDILDRCIFYDMCYDNLDNDGTGRSEINSTLKDVFTNMPQRVMRKKSIINEEYILMTLGLIEYDGNTEYIRLTGQGKDLYYGDDAQAFEKSFKCRDIYAFIEKTHGYIHDKNVYDSDAPISRCAYVLHRIMYKLEKSNTHIPEVELISKLVPHEYERALFYSIAKDMIDDDTTSLTYEVKSIFPRQQRRKTLNDFKDKNNSLQKQGFVEIERKSSLFGEEINLILTDQAKETLLGEDASLYINEVSNKQLLPCDKITKKTLFFSGELDEQLSLLRNSLL